MALNGTMELIETVTVGSGGAANIDFQNIPQTYTDLKLVISARSTQAGVVGTMVVDFNGSSSNFSSRFLEGSGSSASSYTGLGYVGPVTGNGATANTFGSIDFYVPNYTGSTNKSFSSDSVTENNATAAYQALGAGLWSQTSAITRITIYPSSGSFVEHSTATLYGISKVPAITKAYGGEIAYDDNYVYHTFPYSGVFTPLENLTVDYLVVAGGAGGGDTQGGGGGAGGLRCTVGATGGGGSLESALSLTASTNYTVTVGAGGAGSTNNVNKGTNGSDSIFSSITSTGGGGGGSSSNSTGASGGSGGGGNNNGTTSPGVAGGTGTANQGYAGGNGLSDGVTNGSAGGGGGAGAAGSIGGLGPNYDAGPGGNGVTTSISGSSTTYAGGGGGGSPTAGTGAAGGTGGGGTGGRSNAAATAGTVNTGGGGGGGPQGIDNNDGKAGGSGIVIVRYAR